MEGPQPNTAIGKGKGEHAYSFSTWWWTKEVYIVFCGCKG